MRAIVVRPPSVGAELSDVDPPTPGVGELVVNVIEAGVCGTDRDIVAGKYGEPPPGRKELILGHENLGRVADGSPVAGGFAPGDVVVATVRRGCGRCGFCADDRSDFCATGGFTERGIRGRDGYFAEQYAERPEYLVKVPQALEQLAVLLEPLSVAEKALEQAEMVRSRTGSTSGPTPGAPTRALVVGTGAIGMLTMLVLRARGVEVTVVDRHGESTTAAHVAGAAGATHASASDGWGAVDSASFGLVVEAAGTLRILPELVRALALNGTLVLTGIPSAGELPEPVALGAIGREIVLGNRAIVGSVNANRHHFERGLTDLGEFERLWPGLTRRLISERRALTDYRPVLQERAGQGIKTVLRVGG